MTGSFLTRGLVMVLGYVYPAYECYKAVEQNKPEIKQLRFWCQYWILVAVLTVCERIGDAFISWVPMYSEAKLAFFIYLWYPKTKGTTYVYDSFFRPYVAKHENEIDRNLIELRTRAGDMAMLYCQRAAAFGQTRFFEILQFVSAQSKPKPKPQKKQQAPPTPSASASAPPKQQTPKTKASQSPNPPKKSQSLPKDLLSPSPSLNKATPEPAEPKAKTENNEAKALQIVPPQPSPNVTSSEPSLKESVMEETIRITRGKLRKARSTGTR